MSLYLNDNQGGSKNRRGDIELTRYKYQHAKQKISHKYNMSETSYKWKIIRREKSNNR